MVSILYYFFFSLVSVVSGMFFFNRYIYSYIELYIWLYSRVIFIFS